MDLTRHAAEVAGEAGAELALLHVASLPAGVDAETLVQTADGRQGAAQVLRADGERQLEPYIRLLDSLGVRARGVVALGDPVEQILATAAREGAGRIIMGTHGRAGLSRLVLGSVAEQVSRRAEVPVQTLRTRHKPSCEARSCGWCAVAKSRAQAQILAEAEG